MRTLAKTGTYALTHFVVAVTVAYALTGDALIALSIGLIEPAVQTLAYAVHERAWERASERKTLRAAGAPAAEPCPVLA
jgi:uncharacterized membrane protein